MSPKRHKFAMNIIVCMAESVCANGGSIGSYRNAYVLGATAETDVKSRVMFSFKAILQVLIYKALYDKSYLGSKTTMTSGEWTCLISFATAPLTCSERGGSEKFKMKIYVSSGIRTHTPPVHDRNVAAP